MAGKKLIRTLLYIFNLPITTISKYYQLKPNKIINNELKFQLKIEKIINNDLLIEVEKEKIYNNNLKIELEKEKIYNNDLKTELEIAKNYNNDLEFEIACKNKCYICLENDLSVCCIPCGHTYCDKCIINTKRCFICRKIIINTQKIYL